MFCRSKLEDDDIRVVEAYERLLTRLQMPTVDIIQVKGCLTTIIYIARNKDLVLTPHLVVELLTAYLSRIQICSQVD